MMIIFDRMCFWWIENKLESKRVFKRKIKTYFEDLAGDLIPEDIIIELIDIVTNSMYEQYKRFWRKYPKSRKRYSTLKVEDVEHPFTRYRISYLLKIKGVSKSDIRLYSKVLFKMTDDEFDAYELAKYQYENK